VEVGGAANDVPRCLPGPSHQQRRMQLILTEGCTVSLETQSALVELHAVIGGNDDQGAVEQLSTLEIVDHLPDQGVDEVHGGRVAGMQTFLCRGSGRDWRDGRVAV